MSNRDVEGEKKEEMGIKKAGTEGNIKLPLTCIPVVVSIHIVGLNITIQSNDICKRSEMRNFYT